MERLVFILFDFGYAITFGILGIVTLLLNVPKEDGMESYKKARKILGSGLIIMSIYCILRLIYPQHHTIYEDFWILVTVTLLFSWLTYSPLLFLMESPRYLRKRFFIDGVSPTIFLFIAGFIGLHYPSAQTAIEIVFGIIFGVKCAWMFYTCLKEYNACQKELDNYYDSGTNIRWIKSLIWICLIISIATVVAFYWHSIHFFYYLSIPVVYGYMVFKIVNFTPKKIDDVRKRNETLFEKPEVQETKTINRSIVDKVEPLLNKWIENKGFCKADITIKDVATEMGTNHNYLSQYINNSLEMTFQLWLNTLRIEESKNILINNRDLSIEEVGAAVGIPQSYNFSKWFKNITMTTPFRYRKENSI